MRAFGWLNIVSGIAVSMYCIDTQSAIMSHDMLENMGTLHIEASVMQAPCSLTLQSEDQTIMLAPVSAHALSHINDRTTITWFSLTLRGCSNNESSAWNLEQLTRTWSLSSPVISLIFHGVQDADSPDLFAVRGEAEGVGLQLFDSQEHPVTPEVESHPVILNPDDNRLFYGVALKRTAGRLVPGQFRCVINFQVNYD